MWTIDILREEHRWISCMLLCLERVCQEAEVRGHLDGNVTAELMALFIHFADGLHQEREERCLFPRLLARARSVAERTEIGRLCGEHEEERRTLGRMHSELLGAVYGDPRSLRVFLREAGRYVELHRAHLSHENRELLPLAEDLLTPEDDRSILQGFAALEGGRARGTAEEDPQDARRIFQRIAGLCERLGVSSHS